MRSRNRALTLTTRRRELLTFIVAYVGSHGTPPTFAEMAEAMGLSSVGTVSEHVDGLLALGYVRRVAAYYSRGIEPTAAGLRCVRPRLVERVVAELAREAVA